MKNGQVLKSDNQVGKNRTLPSENHAHNRLHANGNSVEDRRSMLTDAISDNLHGIDSTEFGVSALQRPASGSSQDWQVPHTKTSTLFIACGTSAAHVASVAKSRNRDPERVKFLAIDTDPQAQRGADGAAPFSDDEFLLLDVAQVGNLLENPTAHEQMTRSLGLDDPNVKAFMLKLLRSGVEHGGQVKKLGTATLYCNWDKVRIAIEDSITALRSQHTALMMQLNSSSAVQLHHRLEVNILFSIGGGTGAGTGIPTTCMVRDLTAGQDVEINGLLITPDVFEKDLAGKSEEWARVQANSAETLREIQAAQSGKLHAQRVMLGPNADLPVPPGLFNKTLVLGRKYANSADLGNKTAALDAIGCFVASHVGTAVGGVAHAEFQNTASMLSMDPLTRRHRNLGSAGYQGIRLDTPRLALHAASRTLMELLKHAGGATSESAVETRLTEWISGPLPGFDATLSPDDLCASLASAVPSAKELTRGLYRAAHGSERDYRTNTEFIAATEPLIAAWSNNIPTEYQGKVVAQAKDLAMAGKAALVQIRDELAEQYGWGAVGQFAEQLTARLTNLANEQRVLSQQEAAASRDAINRALVALAPVRKKWVLNKAAQDEVVRSVQLAISKKFWALYRSLAVQVFKSLVEQAQILARKAIETVESVKVRYAIAKAKHDDTASGRRLTTNIAVELDASTAALDDQLFEEHRLEPAEWFARLRNQSSAASLLQQLASNPTVFDQVLQSLQRYFERRYAKHVNLVDIMGARLRNPELRSQSQALLSHMVNKCHAMWQAESGQAGLAFADSMLVGIPSGTSRTAQSEVREVILAVARREMHPNSQYGCKIQFVETEDPHCLFAARTSFGACIDYLPPVHKMEAARAQWLRSGGHSLSIFNDAISQRLETLIPLTHVDDVDLALALGVAFGWIAQRGTRWYYNLSDSMLAESGKFEINLSSHWNGLAFRDGKRTADSAALQAMIDSGKLIYHCSSSIAETDCIGADLNEALAAMGQNLEMIERILEAYSQLRGIVGNATIIKELEKYVGQLKTSQSSSANANNMAIERMISHLEFQIEQVRAGR